MVNDFFFGFLILPGCSFKYYHLFSHEAQSQNVPNSLTEGMGFIAHMFRASHKQWKVAILILIRFQSVTRSCSKQTRSNSDNEITTRILVTDITDHFPTILMTKSNNKNVTKDSINEKCFAYKRTYT